MSSLSEIDRDLDQIAVDAALLATVQKSAGARATQTLGAIDEELAALASGTGTYVRTPAADVSAGSGQIDVPDDVLKSSELPAVLALPDETPLSLDPDSGETPLEEPAEIPAARTAPSVMPPPPAASNEPPTETRALGDDPNADLADLLGDSDPMREEAAAALAATEIEPEATTMFTAEDAARYSRPAPPLDESDLEAGDAELVLDDEMIEIDEEPAAARPKTQPPPPPRTMPPPPPGTRPSEAPAGRGFLGKLLQRKP